MTIADAKKMLVCFVGNVWSDNVGILINLMWIGRHTSFFGSVRKSHHIFEVVILFLCCFDLVVGVFTLFYAFV